MGRILTNYDPIFFVCGTPSDRFGFEYHAFDGLHLPSQAPNLLDVRLGEKFPKSGQETYYVRRTRSNDADVAIYVQYRWIHPNDAKHNRGAFIGVGCWISVPLTPAQAMEALHWISTIHEDLTAIRIPDTDSFPPDFRLSEYSPPRRSNMYRAQLSDVLCQAAAGSGKYQDKDTSVTLTTEEIRQGSLVELSRPSRPVVRAQEATTLPKGRSWRGRLGDVLQDAMREAPQTRNTLRKLLELEDEREKMISSLSRTFNERDGDSRMGRRAPDGVRRAEKGLPSILTRAIAARMRVRTRDLVIGGIGVFFAVAAVVAAVFFMVGTSE